jgi:hypothetical protein
LHHLFQEVAAFTERQRSSSRRGTSSLGFDPYRSYDFLPLFFYMTESAGEAPTPIFINI